VQGLQQACACKRKVLGRIGSNAVDATACVQSTRSLPAGSAEHNGTARGSNARHNLDALRPKCRVKKRLCLPRHT
jgi:hypothetical protein